MWVALSSGLGFRTEWKVARSKWTWLTASLPFSSWPAMMWAALSHHHDEQKHLKPWNVAQLAMFAYCIRSSRDSPALRKPDMGCRSVIPAPRRWRQEIQKFKVFFTCIGAGDWPGLEALPQKATEQSRWLNGYREPSLTPWVLSAEPTWWKERTNNHKLSSDLHRYPVAHIYTNFKI